MSDLISRQGFIDAFRGGIVLPKNPTNGDVIKALFPNNRYMPLIHEIALYADKSRQEIIAKFPMSWWNAQYKEEQE